MPRAGSLLGPVTRSWMVGSSVSMLVYEHAMGHQKASEIKDVYQMHLQTFILTGTLLLPLRALQACCRRACEGPFRPPRRGADAAAAGAALEAGIDCDVDER